MNPNPSGKRNFDGVELLQFAVNETQRFYTDLSAKIGAAIETGQIPVSSGQGFLQQLTMPQYIAFAPQPHLTQSAQPIMQQPIVAAPQQVVVPGLVHNSSQAGKKVKRKLSAFNVYMQKKCEQLKIAGVGQADRFQTAAVSWKNLTQEQRQGYIQMYHANEEDPALDILPEPLPGVNNESRAERRREKLAAAEKKQTESSVTDFMAQMAQEKQAGEVAEEVAEEVEDRTESEDKSKKPQQTQSANKKPRKS